MTQSPATARSTYRCTKCGHESLGLSAHWGHLDESPACAVDVLTIRAGSGGQPEVVDTRRVCQCGQAITVVHRDTTSYRQPDDYSTECGGWGEGSCDAVLDGTADDAPHAEAIAMVVRMARPRPRRRRIS